MPELNPSHLLSSTGLGLDIVGVVLLYLYGLPADVKRGGPGYLVWGRDQEEAKRAKRYDRLSRLGLILLVIGFMLQIAANHV